MEFGYVLAGQYLSTDDPRQRFLEAVEQVRAARDAGFTSIWATQHFLADFQFMQPMPFLARLAAEAEGMTLVTAVTVAPLYPVALLAEEVATLDVITGGRFVLGLGAGYRDVEFDAVGVSKGRRFRTLSEMITLLRELWSGEVVDRSIQNQRFENVRMTMPPLQGAQLPIWVGAQGPRGLQIAAEQGDDWLISPEVGLSRLVERRDIYENALPAGVPISRRRLPAMREAFIGASQDEAVRIAGDALRTKYAAYASWGNAVGSFEGLVSDAFLLGSPADCIASINRYRDELGTSMLGLRMQWPGLDQRDVIASIEAAADVIAGHKAQGST